MTEIDPDRALRKLIVGPEDVCRVVVISLAPGFTSDEQLDISSKISEALQPHVVKQDVGVSMQVDFIVQVDVVQGD